MILDAFASRTRLKRKALTFAAAWPMFNISQTFGCAEMDMMGFPLRPVIRGWIWPWLLLAVAATSPVDVAAGDLRPDQG